VLHALSQRLLDRSRVGRGSIRDDLLRLPSHYRPALSKNACAAARSRCSLSRASTHCPSLSMAYDTRQIRDKSWRPPGPGSRITGPESRHPDLYADPVKRIHPPGPAARQSFSVGLRLLGPGAWPTLATVAYTRPGLNPQGERLLWCRSHLSRFLAPGRFDPGAQAPAAGRAGPGGALWAVIAGCIIP
jgi:hypothetical protein